MRWKRPRVDTIWHNAAALAVIPAVLFAVGGCGGSTVLATDAGPGGQAGNAGDADAGGAGAAGTPALDASAGAAGTDAGDVPGCVGSWTALHNSALSPRTKPSLVWTGDTLLIRGGGALLPDRLASDQPGLSDGAAFTPDTGAWSALPAYGKPRGDAFAAWTGGEVVVFGGWVQQNLNGPYEVLDGFRMTWPGGATTDIPPAPGTGWIRLIALLDETIVAEAIDLHEWCRFPLATSIWTCTAAPGFWGADPLALMGSDLGFAGREVVRWGATDDASDLHTTGSRYSLDTDAWTPMSESGTLTPRRSPILAWLGDRLLVLGGRDANDALLDNGAFYDLASDTWTPMTPVPDAQLLYGNVLVVRAGERVVLWNDNDARGAVYDLASRSWMALCRAHAMPPDNYSPGAIWTGSELIVIGGAASSAAQIGARLMLP